MISTICKDHKKVQRGDFFFAWGGGNVKAPRWYEAYVLHPSLEAGVCFDLLAWGLGVSLGFRYKTYHLNIGPLQIWLNGL